MNGLWIRDSFEYLHFCCFSLKTYKNVRNTCFNESQKAVMGTKLKEVVEKINGGAIEIDSASHADQLKKLISYFKIWGSN